jgi:hypothetical protein
MRKMAKRRIVVRKDSPAVLAEGGDVSENDEVEDYWLDAEEGFCLRPDRMRHTRRR